MGSGRSGTTLLDIILGNEDSFFSAGELNRIPKLDFHPHDPRDEFVIKFWNQIKDSLTNYEREFPYFKKLDYHYGFLYRFLNKKIFDKYVSYNNELFTSISKVSEKKYIIDSSKYPFRALWLQKIFNKNIYFIYLKKILYQ